MSLELPIIWSQSSRPLVAGYSICHKPLWDMDQAKHEIIFGFCHFSWFLLHWFMFKCSDQCGFNALFDAVKRGWNIMHHDWHLSPTRVGGGGTRYHGSTVNHCRTHGVTRERWQRCYAGYFGKIETRQPALLMPKLRPVCALQHFTLFW